MRLGGIALAVAAVLLLAVDAEARGGRGGAGGGRGGAGRGGNVGNNRVGGAGEGVGRTGGAGSNVGRAGGATPGNNFSPSQIGQGFRMPGAQGAEGAGERVGDAQIGNRAQNSNLGERNVAGNAQNKASQLRTNFNGQNRPFTQSWYANRPGAWRYPHADAWAVASLGGVGAWLGVAALNNGGTVYTAETAGDEAAETTQPVNDQQQYLPLGVFAIAPQGQPDAQAMIQIALDKQGNIAGNYYDVLTGQEQQISGTVDKKTQNVAFKIIPSGQVQFQTTLKDLTQATGSINVKFTNGESRNWVLARFDDANTK